MAKGLKVGDAVTVRKEMRLPRKDPAYKAGLKHLKPGEIGRIVEAAEGRSVVVEFDGKRVTLASQRLEFAKPAPAEESKPRSKPAPRAEAAPVGAEPNLIDYVNASDPQFIRGAANQLLRAGGELDTVIVQIRLSDLPTGVQSAVKALIEKKLELGLPGAAPATTGARRGRKPKSAQS